MAALATLEAIAPAAAAARRLARAAAVATRAAPVGAAPALALVRTIAGPMPLLAADEARVLAASARRGSGRTSRSRRSGAAALGGHLVAPLEEVARVALVVLAARVLLRARRADAQRAAALFALALRELLLLGLVRFGLVVGGAVLRGTRVLLRSDAPATPSPRRIKRHGSFTRAQ